MVLGDDDPIPFFGWGSGVAGEACYWHMSSDNPNEWAAVVFSDSGIFDYHPCGMLAYLTDLISGRFPSETFAPDDVQLIGGPFGPFNPDL